ncbi:MAG: lipid-A-disaccharide synthase [Flavobacteriaceae bacterium]
MKYYIIAGEASGDLHGSHLMTSLLQYDQKAEIRFWGGDLMHAQGGTLVKHYRDLAFMGFWEVFINLITILKNIAFCKKDIAQFNPDVIIYIDYPGFNMRIAAWAKEKGYLNHYYISPQIWAWKENRIKKIKRDLDALYVILPFEQHYFKKQHNYTVDYVGNPLTTIIKTLRDQNEKSLPKELITDKPIIALLPGSRKQEIDKMMPVFLTVIQHFSQYQFVIAGAPGIDPQWYQKYTISPAVSLLHNQTYLLLKNAHAAIVTSGTATLETALFKVPQMVCYKTSTLSLMIAKMFVKLKFISLVNLIMEKEVVRELIQGECTPKNIRKELENLLDPDQRQAYLNNYQRLEDKLGQTNASDRVAKKIYAKLI